MNQNKSVNIILIVVIVVLVGAVTYFALRKSSLSPVNQVPVSDQTVVNNQVSTPTITNTPKPVTTQTNANQTVSVRLSISSMNENVYSLLNPTTILGLKYLYPRTDSGNTAVVNAIDPTALSMGDSCGETVQAVLEIANPKIEGTHATLHGDPTVAVDVIKVISHDKPQRNCAY